MSTAKNAAGDQSGRMEHVRRRAADKVRGNAPGLPEIPGAPSTGEASRLLHELQVHQIELEMQNEELRLALVKRIVAVHGGRIWVESAGAGKGTGATFRFTRAR